MKWFGCYDGFLKHWIVPRAYQHPAIERIYVHAREEAWLQPGQHVLDPLAGVAIGGIAAANAGLRWTGIELEGHFVALAEENLAKHAQTWAALDKPLPVIRQGDARRLLELCPRGNVGATTGQLGAMPTGDAQAVITSPPYADADNRGKSDRLSQGFGRADGKKRPINRSDYGASPGQLGALPTGDPAQVIQAVGSAPAACQPIAHMLATPPQTLPQPEPLGEETVSGLPNDYWGSVALIYQSCFALLPPGGKIILVLKGYVRKGQYVDLPRQTADLLAGLGFRLLHWHRAWLVDRVAQARFDGGEDRRARKSFFRRLQEQKGGPPVGL